MNKMKKLETIFWEAFLWAVVIGMVLGMAWATAHLGVNLKNM